jgi:hypothetical protein
VSWDHGTESGIEDPGRHQRLPVRILAILRRDDGSFAIIDRAEIALLAMILCGGTDGRR